MGLSKRQIKALEGSIKKWELILAGKTRDFGTSNCPLCKNYFKNDCKHCPVKLKTTYTNCLNTPYMDWYAAGGYLNQTTILTPERQKYAKDELIFLQNLLLEATAN